MTTQTLDDLLDEFQTCAYQSCFSLCDELRIKIKALAQPEQESAIKTLKFLGYTYHGGEHWKPPLGNIPAWLAQPELCKYGQEPKSCTSSPMDCQCAIDATFAQPEQEPVGEAYLCDRCHTPLDGAFQCPSCGHGTATKEPVYTTPPQRKPLTDEQVWNDDELMKLNAVMMLPMEYFMRVVRAIEAAHGIKE